MKKAFQILVFLVLVVGSTVAARPYEPYKGKIDKDLNLIKAVWEGDIWKVELELRRGASVVAQDKQGMTALVAASYRNDVAIAELLINHGADVNQQDSSKQNAFLISAREGYLEILKLTLQNGADVFSTDSWGGNGLIRAGERGYFEIVEELLKAGAYVDHMNDIGMTALLEAIWFSNGDSAHIETVRVLIEGGADVCLNASWGTSPLEMAEDYPTIAELLIDAGALDCPE